MQYSKASFFKVRKYKAASGFTWNSYIHLFAR